MGTYTENLLRRGHKPAPQNQSERLVACAIVRDGVTESRGFKSHAEIRAALGDEDPYRRRLYDVEGFLTSTGRFVDREEAKIVGEAAGQCPPMRRELLSSDVSW